MGLTKSYDFSLAMDTFRKFMFINLSLNHKVKHLNYSILSKNNGLNNITTNYRRCSPRYN